MVAVKGRLNPPKDRTTQDQKMSKRGEVKDFKIYVEVDYAKNPDTLKNGIKRQPVPRKSGSYLLNASDSKSGIKNLEKGKSKPDKSMSTKVGRKVLADIGNWNSSFPKTEQGKSCRTGKGKSELMLYPQRKDKSEMILHPERAAMDLGNTEGSSSGKLSMETVKLDLIQATVDNQISKKLSYKNTKATSNDPMIKPQGRSTITATATGRKSVRNPLHLTRKSLPVLKQASQVETSGSTKGSSGKSDNLRGKHGIPVKPKGRSSITATATATGRKSVRNPLHLTRKSLPVLKQASQVETSGSTKRSSGKSDNLRGKHGIPVKPSMRRSFVPKPSNLSNHPLGNRVSDGFIAMSSRVQSKMDAGLLSRKSVKATVQTTVTAHNTQRNSKSSHIFTTITARNAQRNSKSSHIFTTKKLTSRQAELSKKKQEKAPASENIPSVVSKDELAPEEDISGGSIPRRKSDRRNSFTSSLMSRSKLLKGSKFTSRESLPSIYDDRNHLEVCDYVDDIYQYYWVMEAQNPLLKNYMGTQRDITPQMRGILINWLIEVHLKFDLMEETLFLTVTLLDRCLSLENIKKNEMQLVGLTALLLASKYEDFWHPRVTDLISISAESYTRDQMLKMEKTILKKLKFRLNEPTPYVFMLRFLKAAQSDMKFERLAFYLIELCLVEYEALSYKPSMLCASAIYVARCTMQMTPWTPLLAKHARYEESQIRDCAEMILKFHKAAKATLLRVTYEKYAKPDYCRVATIKPLDRLPALYG